MVENNEPARGFVEHLTPEKIAGWCFEEGAAAELVVVLSDRSHALQPNWQAREDVAAVFGPQALQSGFECLFDGALAQQIQEELAAGRSPRLRVNGKLLPLAPELIAQAKRGPAPTVSGYLEKCEQFALQGWTFVDQGRRPGSVELRVDGVALPCTPIWQERRDVEQALGTACEQPGFTIALPGALWEQVPADAAAELSLVVEGQPLPERICLTRQDAASWIQALIDLPEGPVRQYRLLLALEHLRYGRISELLSERARAALQAFGERMNLAAFLPQELAPHHRKAEFAESYATLLHWQALRALNARLHDGMPAATAFDAIAATLDEQDLPAEIRQSFLGSIIPFLCRHDIFHRLRELDAALNWERLADGEDAWPLSTALPALAFDGKVGLATETLGKLAKHLGRGWINTECIHYAVRAVNRQLRAGTLDAPSAEKFAYAVLALLEAFRGEWFSRLHDLELIRASVALLDTIDRHADQFRLNLVHGLIRNLGLAPEFWQCLDAMQPGFADVELELARGHWNRLQVTLGSKSPAATMIEALLPVLRYFRRQRNLEVMSWVRELAMHTLPMIGSSPRVAEVELFEMLLEDPAEGVRLAAFPLVEETLLARFPEASSKLLQTLRTISPRPQSPFYSAQCRLGAHAEQIRRALTAEEPATLEPLLSAQPELAAPLMDASSQYLAAAVLAWSSELPSSHGATADDAWERKAVRRMIRKAILDGAPEQLLPAPICSAITRLVLLAEHEPSIQAFVAEIERAVASKFHSDHAFLFTPPPPACGNPPGRGLHADTLVVIYSCRKYLDLRIPTIRQSWARDLAARGIPYLILVGEGNGTIAGDVLALDVSDRYEDLPKKTLKLFDWVLQHTSYQYVYKIDDDCYLDVARFFDTLSYRKHHYYGRVIERGIGSMDRTWHQPKAHSEQARKAIDKSPEPSVYADGGGGYALSRPALYALHSAAQSAEGQRLAAVSMMEDKLVGDLLALRQISPSNQDYESYQRRRTFGEAVPVGMWENTFYPTGTTPTVMCHLDSNRDIGRLQALQQQQGLLPHRIWPTCTTPLIHPIWTPDGMIGSNQLELLSDPARLRGLLAAPPYVLAAMRNEIKLLPHFLAHYRQLGARAFLIADNLSDDGTREFLLEQPDVALFSADTEYKHSHFGVAWQQAILGNFCIGQWVLLADADELLVYPDCEEVSLVDYLATLEREGADCVRTMMVDMYPYGDLGEADFRQATPFAAAPWFDRVPALTWRLGSGHFSNSRNWTSALRHRIDTAAVPHGFVVQKYALFRYQPGIRLSQGIHYMAGFRQLAQRPVWFAHFKYHAGFKDKVEQEIHRGQHFDNAKEYRRYAAMLAEELGYFGNERVSARYAGSLSFKDLP